MIHEWPLEVARWVMEDFGKSLLKLRKARKLTQLQLAELIEVQPRLVSRWETGESKPHFDHIVRLAEILEVSLDMLVRGSDTSTCQGTPRFPQLGDTHFPARCLPAVSLGWERR